MHPLGMSLPLRPNRWVHHVEDMSSSHWVHAHSSHPHFLILPEHEHLPITFTGNRYIKKSTKSQCSCERIAFKPWKFELSGEVSPGYTAKQHRLGDSENGADGQKRWLGGTQKCPSAGPEIPSPPTICLGRKAEGPHPSHKEWELTRGKHF